MNRKMSLITSGVRTVLCAALLAPTLSATALAADDSAANPAKAELTAPRNEIELGAGAVSSNSYKFGEYNGLGEQGKFAVGSFNLAGGGSYDSADATRWKLTGTNLGLQSRSAALEYGVQGKFRFTAGFDQLRRNQWDTYQTPYVGAGSNILTLPSTWIAPIVPRVSATAGNARGLLNTVTNSSALVTGVLTAPTSAMLTTAAALQAADLPAFHSFNLYTTREKYQAGFSYVLTPKWDFAINAQRETKDGTKPMGSVTRSGTENSTTLPDPIDTRTDLVAVTLGRRSKSDFITLAYNASIFHNNISSLTWTNWTLPSATMTMSSAPSNQMHQFSLTAGHDFTSSTRLVGNVAYSRSSQNDTFLTNASTPIVPVVSPDALIVSKAAYLKLTSRPVKDLSLGLSYKYDERDNQTPVHLYGFYDTDNPPGSTALNAAYTTALGVAPTLITNAININANRPYSRKQNLVEADADYRLTPTEAIKASYQFEQLHRWCNGSWIDCVDAATTKENTANLEWRANPFQSLNARLAYTYGSRSVGNYNENAFLAVVPMVTVAPSTATGGISPYAFMLANGWTGYGPQAGYAATAGNMNLYFPLNNALANATYLNQNRISELIGMRRYNEAARRRNRGKGNLDWQATDKVSVATSLDYKVDEYNDSVYGLSTSHDWSANLEGSFSPTESLGFTLFYTHEDLRQVTRSNSYTANSAAANVNTFTAISGGCYSTIALRNASNKIDPCLDWHAAMEDRTNLYGFSVSRKNLLDQKLDLGAQVVVSRSTTDNNVMGGNYANNPLAVAGAAAGTVAAFFIPAAPLPQVIANSVELHLSARYALSTSAAVRVAYTYGELTTNDYAYQGYQLGGATSVMPTGQLSPNYHVQVIALSYTAIF